MDQLETKCKRYFFRLCKKAIHSRMLPVLLASIGNLTTSYAAPHINRIYNPSGMVNIENLDDILPKLEESFSGRYTKKENDSMTSYSGATIDLYVKQGGDIALNITNEDGSSEELHLSNIDKIKVAEVSTESRSCKRLVFSYKLSFVQGNGLSYSTITYYDFDMDDDSAEAAADHLETLSMRCKEAKAGIKVKQDDEKAAKVDCDCTSDDIIQITRGEVQTICEKGSLDFKHVEQIVKVEFDDCVTGGYAGLDLDVLRGKFKSLVEKFPGKMAYILYCGNADVRVPIGCYEKTNMELSYKRGFNLASFMYRGMEGLIEGTTLIVHPNDIKKDERSAYIYFVTEKTAESD